MLVCIQPSIVEIARVCRMKGLSFLIQPLLSCYSLPLQSTTSSTTATCQPYHAHLRVSLGTGKHTILTLLSVGARILSRGLSPSLLKKSISGVGKQAQLSGLDALKPVSKGGANAGVEGVCPHCLAGEEGTHFDAELPDADGDA